MRVSRLRRADGQAGGRGVMAGVVDSPRLKPRLGYLSVNRRLLGVALATVGLAEPRVYSW